MNKYQLAIVSDINVRCEKSESKPVRITEDTITFKENNDLDTRGYRIVLETGDVTGVSTVEWLIGDKSLKVKPEVPEIDRGRPYMYNGRERWNASSPEFDFRDEAKRPKAVRLGFLNDLADPVEIVFAYENGDDEAFAKRKAEQKKADDEKAIDIKIQPGNDLLNVYFKLANPSVKKSLVSLEAIIEIDHRTSERREVDKKSLIFGKTFVSFNGLAHGRYVVTITQLDRGGRVVAEASKECRIDPPVYGSGRPVNVIS